MQTNSYEDLSRHELECRLNFLENLIKYMTAELAKANEKNDKLTELNKEYKVELDRINELYKLALDRIFGRKTEKIEAVPDGQLSFFDLVSDEDLLKAKVTLAELQLEAAKEKNNSTSSDLTKAQNKLTKAQKAFKDYRTVQKKKVTKVKVKAGKKKATISWKSLGKGYTYTVYQLNPKTGAYKAVKTTKKTKVVVKKLKKGKKYFFKVQAKKKVGGYVALTKESKVVKSKKIK